jgi:hypothetical protein
MFVQVTATGKISQADRYGMMAALTDSSVNEDDRRSIDRILYALRRGQVHVVDELSILK